MARNTRSKSPAKAKEPVAAIAKAEEKEEEKTNGWGAGGLFANRILGSWALTLLTPPFILLLWYVFKENKGDIMAFFHTVKGMGVKSFLVDELYVKANPWKLSSWKTIGCFMAFELFLMRFVPGKEFKATPTKTGHVPVYNANGPACYLISIIALVCLRKYSDWNPAQVYHEMGHLLASMLVFALSFCVLLTIKGLHFPSTADCGTNGSFIVDYFWGTELYPRIFGFDVKQFTNCRFGMIFWQLGPLCYAYAQYDELGHVSSALIVSVAIQTVYIAKFFWWETGYVISEV